MEELDKKKQKKGMGAVSTLILVLALCVFCFAGFKLLSILRDYRSSNDEYEELTEDFTQKTGTDSTAGRDAGGAPSPPGDLIEDADPPLTVDWADLKAVNPDIVGWIYVDGEKGISYPVCRAEDNDYYLHRTFRKEQRYAGSIFMDYHNQGDWADPNTIVYGHNMRNGSMFGTLKFLYDQAKYDKDPYFWILTPQGNYRYHIYAIFRTKVDSAVYTLYSQNGPEFLDWEKHIKEGSGVQNEVPLTEQDKTVVLSTCTSDQSERCVVIGKCVSSVKPTRSQPINK